MDADDDGDGELDEAQLRAELEHQKAEVRRELAIRRRLLGEKARLEAETSALKERAAQLGTENEAMRALLARLQRLAEANEVQARISSRR